MTKASLLDALIAVRIKAVALEAVEGRSRECSQVITKLDEARLWTQELPDPETHASAPAPNPIPPMWLSVNRPTHTTAKE